MKEIKMYAIWNKTDYFTIERKEYGHLLKMAKRILRKEKIKKLYKYLKKNIDK